MLTDPQRAALAQRLQAAATRPDLAPDQRAELARHAANLEALRRRDQLRQAEPAGHA